MGRNSKITTIFKKNRIITTLVAGGLVLFFLFLLIVPVVSFNDSACTVVESNSGALLGAHIADDGQWRFPEVDSVPICFEQAILSFEDRHFYYHPGVNPISLIRATRSNLKAGKIVQGGSTLTMQVVRLSRKGKKRTYAEKTIEIALALRLELACTKKEILRLYASYAPFGGNVVGLEAAAWRYFNRSPNDLSVAEAATLAVLPNAPSIIHLSKNREHLKAKRDRLLTDELNHEIISQRSYDLAVEEPLPNAPQPLPQLAPVLTSQLSITNNGERVASTIDKALQRSVINVLKRHNRVLETNQVHNLAALIVEVSSGDIVSYVGNVCMDNHPQYSPDVDLIRAARSTGSIMKPFLYAAMLDDGQILPNMLVADVPTNYKGYSPKNYAETYSGAVPAWQALSQSLNVPAVRMLEAYGVDRFHALLKSGGISTLNYPPSHYGLSLILGGSEATLWDLSAMYASMARELVNDRADNWHGITYNSAKRAWEGGKSPFSRAAISCTFDAMKHVHRPQQESGWENFSSSQAISWKTGTSFGFRDAWAVGVTPKYVVSVWVGNADGEGRPGLTGTSCAAPVMFDIFELLPTENEFEKPIEEMEQIAVCAQTGFRISRNCNDSIMMWVPKAGLKSPPCPYHKIIHLDSDALYRVTASCYPATQMVHKSWFVLPPVLEWYYKKRHPEYRQLPPYAPSCLGSSNDQPLDFVYPNSRKTVFLPTNLDGEKSDLILEATHKNRDAVVYWYLDNSYLGSTQLFHNMACTPTSGKHRITIVDDGGSSKEIDITVK